MVFDPKDLSTARQKLAEGDVIAAPAEGVYGYCADPFNPKALEKLVALKKRNQAKGFVTLIGSRGGLEKLTTMPLSEASKKACAKHWPGQVTLLFPVRSNLPDMLTGQYKDIAVRLPAAEHMQTYLTAWGGPLVSTSANVSGQPPITDPNDIPKGVFVLRSDVLELDGSVSRVYDPHTDSYLR